MNNSLYDGSRNPTSQVEDAQGAGIRSLYAVGTNVDCAVVDPEDLGTDSLWGIEPDGTSQAAATVAGMTAYLLAHPVYGPVMRAVGNDQVAARVKEFLQDTGRQLKGDICE